VSADGDQIGALLNALAREGRVAVTRNGKPLAILIVYDDDEENMRAHLDGFLDEGTFIFELEAAS
jgi:hypothetical protein